MAPTRAAVSCPACEFDERFARLRDARAAVEAHREETGHDPRWRLGSLAPGVERAGDRATVCGREEGDCGGALTPFVERRE